MALAISSRRKHGHFLCLALLLIILVFWSAQASCSRQVVGEKSEMWERFEEWVAKYGRVYKDEEEKERRFNIFKRELDYIEKVNKIFPSKLRLNQFADLTHEEFLASYTSRSTHGGNNKKGRHKIMSREETKVAPNDYNTSDLPGFINWAEHGAVTPAKNQQFPGGNRCGSSWAFAAVAAVEGLNQIKTGMLVPLSEQELIDCDHTNGSQHGCHGGQAHLAFEYMIKRNKSLATQNEYPYKGVDGNNCTADDNKDYDTGVISITDYACVTPNDEKALMAAVARQPVVASVDASSLAFKYYSGDYFWGRSCGTNLNHEVTIVGYEFGFWVIKNSWGDDWGFKGYMFLERSRRNDPLGACGINMYACYPIA